jgi:hypothetical protein
MPKLKKFKRGDKVDITTWDLEALDDIAKELFRERFLRAVGEVIDLAILENTWVDFVDGNPDVLRIDLPFGDYEDRNPSFDVSLTHVVKWQLEINTVPSGGIPEGESEKRMKSLRDHFLKLAKMIDDKLPS